MGHSRAAKIAESSENDVLFSAASIWELAIKLQIGGLNLPVELDTITESAKLMGFSELPVTAAHAVVVRYLPLYHRDPFDRLLVAQAIYEPARFLTVDPVLSQYTHWVESIKV